MRVRPYLWLPGWLLVGLCVILSGCGGTTATVRPTPTLSLAQQRLLGGHLRDATFTITFTTDSTHGTGTGTLTTKPELVHLSLNAGQQILIDTTDGLLYGRLATDHLWSILNDAESSIFINYDTDVWDPAQLQAPQIIGSETLAGVPTWHVRAAFAAPMLDTTGSNVAAPGTVDVWLRQSDDLPVQLIKKASLSGTASDGTPFTVSLAATYHFTAWNTGVTITLPTPDQISASG